MKKIILLLLVILPVIAFAQKTRVIKGKVVGESDGLALPGASVYIDKNTIGEKTELKGVIKNFSLGTTTNIDGEFTFTLPEGVDQLVCSFMGYESQKVNIKGKYYIVVKLKDENKVLNEVVVTGYQKIEKRKVTSSVIKVKTDAIMQAGVASVDQMLDGQLAGVQTTVTNGAPGAPAKIRIRGTASLSGSQDPLWVLDGMPLEGTDLPDMEGKNIDQLVNSSIAGLNPNDIADITILKDAAATAIYGARAANGVIVITTKKGKKGKLSVNLNSNMSFMMKPDMDRLNLMNSSQKLDMELDLARYSDLASDNVNTSKGAIARIFKKYNITDSWNTDSKFADLPQDIQNEINALRAIDTNWGDELYQTAVNHDHSLSISGGDDRACYYFSAGYHDEKGTTIGTGMDRFNITLKVDYKLADNLTVGASIYTNERKQTSYLTGTGSFTNPSRYSRMANPYLPVRDENGDYAYDPDIDLKYNNVVPFNIIQERENTSNIMKTRSTNAVFDLDWKVIDGLSFRTQLGVQRDNSNTEKYAHKDSYFARLQQERAALSGEYFIPEGGVLQNWESNLSQWNLKTMLEYNLNINDMHEFDFMVGNELRRTENKSIFSAAYGFNKETLTSQHINYPNASWVKTFPLFRKTYVENAYASFFGTFAYTYNKKYTFFGSVRMDGSDLFGVDPKYRYLPLWAASGAWRAKEESWLKDVEWLTALKFRASYGLQGNIDKGTSKFIIGEKDIAEILPGNSEQTIIPTNLPNDRLRWEKTATWNGGFDLGVFRNIVRVSADFYNRKSTDLIGIRSMPLENGMGSASINWAALTNKGFEINLITRNVYTPDFKWQTTFNVAKNINTVDKIHVPDNQTTPSLLGHSVNSLFAYKTAGLDEDGYMLFWRDGEKVSADKYFGLVDEWGIGVPTSPSYTNQQYRDLFTYVGSTDPKLSGGLINKITYKNFTLNISCSYNIGQTVKIEPFYDLIQMDRGVNRSTMMDKVWSPLNKEGIYPRMIGPYTEGGTRMGEFFVYDQGKILQKSAFRDLDIWYKEVNFLRVNSIRLGYNIPASLLSKLGISSAKVNIESRNPFVFASNYDGYFDPETMGNIYAQPVPKSITVGLNVTF